MLVSVSSNGEGQLAAGDDRPLPVRAKLRKGAVEGQAVSVAFGIGERPVNVENERLQLDRLPPRRAEGRLLLMGRSAGGLCIRVTWRRSMLASVGGAIDN
jgi:hypothetical protein